MGDFSINNDIIYDVNIYVEFLSFDVFDVIAWCRVTDAMGSRWVAMGCNGLQWGAMGCNGARWFAMGRDGLQWGAMGRDGSRWVAMGSRD